MTKLNIGTALLFFFIFILLIGVEFIMDIFLLPADEILVPGEVIMDALIFTVMVFSALSGGGQKALKVRQ
jgi:hypothetical protein